MHKTINSILNTSKFDNLKIFTRMSIVGFDSSYFSLEDILASQERVPCQVMDDLPNLSFLDSSVSSAASASRSLPAGSKPEIPLWMAAALQRGGKIKPEAPKQFQSKAQLVMLADATVLDLQKWGPFFYESGRHYMKLAPTSETEELGRTLLTVMTKRFRKILDSSQNAEERDSLSEMQKLDELERFLFQASQASKRNVDNWYVRKTGHMNASSIVQTLKKRKAMD